MINAFTSLLTNGIISSDVGRLTTKPNAKERNHLSKKSGTKPKFTMVRIKDMEKDMPKDMKTPNRIVAYFLFIFNLTTIPLIDFRRDKEINVKSSSTL